MSFSDNAAQNAIQKTSLIGQLVLVLITINAIIANMNGQIKSGAKMKQLTKKQLDKLISYCRGRECRNILGNGEVGYYKPKKILIVCCGNCGDYIWVKIRKEDLK